MKKNILIVSLLGLLLVGCSTSNNDCNCSCVESVDSSIEVSESVSVEENLSNHEHIWEKGFDDESHYEECACGEKQNIGKHSYDDVETNGYVIPTCSCGHTGTPIEVSNIISVYFSAPNSEWWGEKGYCYLWKNGVDGSEEAAWPGNEMTYITTNDYGQKVFTYEVDLAKFDMIIFSNGSGWQTQDISLSGVLDNSGFYLNDDGSTGTYTYAA